MSKKAAATAATETAEGFNGLSDDNRTWMKSFEDLGWRFSFDEEGFWNADNDGLKEPDALHYFGSFMVMMNTVEAAEKKLSGLEPVAEDIKGNTFLPGIEPLSNKQLDALIRSRVGLVREHKQLTAQIIEVNEECLNAFEVNKSLFILDADTGKHVYSSPGGGQLRIRHTSVDKVETELEDPDDE